MQNFRNIFYFGILLLFLSNCSKSDYDDGGSTLDKLSSSSFTSGEGVSNGENGNNDTIQSGQITAGEWSDLQNWNFWKDLQQNQDLMSTVEKWSFYNSNRISFIIKDLNQQPAEGCLVKLKEDGNIIWETKTDNTGQAELWYNLFTDSEPNNALTATISYNGFDTDIDNLLYYTDTANIIQLSFATTQPTQVDIHFMVDATGSMGDELEYLKVELNDVIQKVQSENSNLTFRFGSVFYRDIGDEYITLKSSFNSSKSVLIDFISSQRASGGGDYEEAVHTALNESLFNQDWGTNNKASLCFIVLDAPPHLTSQVIDNIHQSVEYAAKQGIKLIPIVASGIDKNTEFLMRFMAITTNGTYVFITNESGIGNEHLEPTIGIYQPEYLNALLVRLINKNIK